MIDAKHVPNQKEYEETQVFLRQHWIIPVGIFITFIVLVLIPVGLYFAIAMLAPNLLASTSFHAVWTLGLSAYALMTVLFYFQTYLDYYLDTWTITNERIMSSERASLFHHTVSELRLFRVQDVTADVKGFLPTIFDYGTVIIQTAGEIEHFTLDNVSHPKKLAEKIIELADADREFHKDKLESIEAKIPPTAAAN